MIQYLRASPQNSRPSKIVLLGHFVAPAAGFRWQSHPDKLAQNHRFFGARSFTGWFLILFLFATQALFAAGVDSGGVLLYNNTSFILTATVQASDGTFLGQFTIQPGQQKNFTTNLSPTKINRPGAPQVSLTPYTVIWQCPSEGFFSTCTEVSPGGLIRAGDCPGSHFCTPKKKDEEKAPASTLQKKK